MKKKEKRTIPGKKLTVNRRTSVPVTETITEGEQLGLSNESGLVDQLQTETDGQKSISGPAASTTGREGPLKFRRQGGENFIDGDESAYIQTFGTSDPDLQLSLLQQVLATFPPWSSDSSNCALASLQAIRPEDPLEGLLAAQMVGVHQTTMRCLERAADGSQTQAQVESNTNLAVKLSRTFASQMEALDRHRGNINQPTVVGNVNVAGGGQALIGNVNHPGPGKVAKDGEKEKAG
jgi:hypothetical protein